jgi:hypothetical protein
MGLRSHKKLLSTSHVAGGGSKIDFLAKGIIELAGLAFPIVLKVGSADQPARIGLDVIKASAMVIDAQDMTYSVADPNFDSLETDFQFLDFDSYMRRVGLQEDDLVGVEHLGEPHIAYAEALLAGHANAALYTGTSSGVSNGPGVYVGVSF